MSLDWVRSVCLSLPRATENVQWGNDLVFKVAGKMFAVAALEAGPHCLSFKCDAEEYAELTERPGIVPAPYLARAQWVALESYDALPPKELKRLIEKSYALVVEQLPAKVRAGLTSSPGKDGRPARR